MDKVLKTIVMVGAILALTSGCVSIQKGVSENLFPKVVSRNTAAVSYIPEAGSGDITALGNLWRDRIEKILSKRGVVIKARKDIPLLIEDIETFGRGLEEKDVWDQAGADIIVSGHYTVLAPEKPSSAHSIRVVVKAYRVSDASLVGSDEFVEPLDPSWVALASNIYGNVHQEKFEVVSSSSSISKKPRLSAGLNKKNSCFKTGESAQIKIETDPGTYVYIFNLTADNNVSLLYPNQWMKNNLLDTRNFVFPPPGNSHGLELLLYPLEEDTPCKESFKIVASKSKLDFSFLPVPENQVFAGANGRDIDRMTQILKQHDDYRQTTLTYFVGKGCVGR